jgi:hypothetical protein
VKGYGKGGTMPQRLSQWVARIADKAKRRWWIWFLLAVWELVKHRIFARANAYIDLHTGSITVILGFVVSHLESVIVVGFLLGIIVLIFHAYLETRPSRSVVINTPSPPAEALELVDVPHEREVKVPRAGATRKYPRDVFIIQAKKADLPSTDPNVTYKNKVRVTLTNAIGKEIGVWTPLWESDEVQSQDIPPGSNFRLEGPRGWRIGDWIKDGTTGKDKGYECLKVKPGFTVECWIGLLPPSGQSISERMAKGIPIGIAFFPVKIDGKLYEEPFEI